LIAKKYSTLWQILLTKGYSLHLRFSVFLGLILALYKMILLNVPIWVAQLIIPIAFTIITLRFLFKSLDLAVTLIKKGEDIVHKVERKTGPLLPEPEEGLNPKKKSEQGGEV